MADEITIVVRAEDAFSSVLGNFGNIMTGIKSTIDLVGSAFRTLSGFAMEGLDAIASYERMGAALTSLTASQILQTGAVTDMATAMEMAAPKAEELLHWIQEVAIKSPFTSEGVAQAFRMAEAYGFTAEESKRLVQALIDFAAGTGATEDSMRRITLALGQISATGKVTGGDMLQLVNAGLPVTQILADGFGVTTAKIMEMRSQGLLPATESIEYITQYLENNFKGAAEAQANTWAGLLGTFQDLKAIGLREFFGGLFDALQPLAVSLSTWLQGPGMIIIGTLGDMLGTVTSNLTSKLADFTPVFNTLNLAFLQFKNLIDDDWTPLQALQKVLFDLSVVWRDTALGDFTIKIMEFITTIQQAGLGTGLKYLFNELFGGFDLQTTLQGILDNITIALGGSDLKPLGEEIAKIFSGAIMTALSGLDIIINQVDWKPVGKALASAIGQMWSGIINDPKLWADSDKAVTDALKTLGTTIGDLFIVIFKGIVDFILGVDQWREIGKALKSGFMAAFDFFLPLDTWVDTHIIQPFRRMLGISSPSTVFMQIGKDIIQGLINGVQSISFLGTFTSMLNSVINSPLWDKIQSKFDEVKNGIEKWVQDHPNSVFSQAYNAATGGGSISISGYSEGGGLAGSGSGTVGGGYTGNAPGSGSSTTTGMGGVVNYNFYGPVYMSGVPAEGTYDCLPNPVMQSGGNQIVPSGFS